MEQKFDGTPHAELRVEGKKVVRTDVDNDWGLRLQWKVTRDGKPVTVANSNARASDVFDAAELEPGQYDVVLEMWRYVSYKKNAQREFVFHDNGWGAYAARLDVYEVPGNHDSMVLEPNVRVMAAALRACIARAEERRAGRSGSDSGH